MNKEPQNVEGFTSIFDISCSTFCGSKTGFQGLRSSYQPLAFDYPRTLKSLFGV